MTNERLFLDTVFIQALLNRNDHQYHEQALALLSRVENAKEVWVIEAILIEVANGLSRLDHNEVADTLEEFYNTDNVKIVTVDTALIGKALKRYRKYADKAWGLTDCISFEVMHANKLQNALTHDQDFVQAGFNAIMRKIL